MRLFVKMHARHWDFEDTLGWILFVNASTPILSFHIGCLIHLQYVKCILFFIIKYIQQSSSTKTMCVIVISNAICHFIQLQLVMSIPYLPRSQKKMTECLVTLLQQLRFLVFLARPNLTTALFACLTSFLLRKQQRSSIEWFLYLV